MTTDAPDPGLTDLIAAEIARHRLRYGSEDAYNGERWLCTACPWLVEADTGSRPNATFIQAHANHVAERLKLVVEQRRNCGQITATSPACGFDHLATVMQVQAALEGEQQ
ncbi:hypothetical protein [Rhodococcus qingshengii]|uniref:hypothetical protein n=1 Tax=Rhodococcus qingshengii TaxID=334542 RepID=UPI001C5F665C|nr:hypothetical protein [Rhodococcus qingshengii]MBW4813332.1 hypothetical protein [Rhodococcus qingshengii]